MRARLALAALALAALLALPGAAAHISDFAQTKTVPVGPYSVYLEPRPTNVYANSTLSIAALISDNASGQIVPDTAVSVSMRMVGPGYDKNVTFQPDGRGYLIGAFVLPSKGGYEATLDIGDSHAHYTSTTSFYAYPDLPIRLRAADQSTNSYVGEKSVLAFETDDPIDLTPVDRLTDLTVRVEHWTDDHKTLLGSDEVPMKRSGPGLWRADYTFPTQGMYHMNFSSRSGGFTYGETPIMHLTAIQGSTPAKKSPDAALALVAPGVGMAAWLLRRRR